MIVVYGVAQHHTRTEWSVVASRREDGTWSVERAGEEGPGLLNIDPRPLPPSKATLSADKGMMLDRLLGDRATFREKVRGGDPSIGGFASEMEIMTPARTRRVSWTGKLVGKLGQVADLVIGAG
jgi:hypothetical protein